MANPRDPSPAPDAERVNPDFPTLVKPDPDNPVIAQQAVRVGEHEKMLAAEQSKNMPAGDPRAVDFGEPAPARPMGTAQDAKNFLDNNNIRTEEQAEREEASRPHPKGESPGEDVASPSKEPMNKVTKPHANQTSAKR